jgi:hypothetical protein
MPPLFPEIARSRKEPLRRGEKLFEFYNECARAGYDEFRSFVNRWIADFPQSDQAELASRMSGGADKAFQSGLIEIVVYAFVRKLNYRVQVHPQIEGSSKRPDFAIIDGEGRLAAFIEVTTVNQPNAVESESNRETSIYNAIDQAKLPTGCVLGYSVIRKGKSSPRLASLIREIESWAEKAAAEEPKDHATRRFVAGDWEVELDLIFANPSKKYEHSIGVASGGANWIAPQSDLRGALEIKAKKYGDLKAPYLIVVADAKGQLFGADDTKDTLTEAVLGDEMVQWREGEPAKLVHAYNGLWRKRTAPRNTQVSAVLLFPDIGVWGLRSEKLQPIMAINPWAELMLPDTLKVVSRFESQDEKWNFINGQNFADILGLPTPWPPEDSR